MATTSKYFFLTPSADNLNFMDFGLSYGSLSMEGEDIKFFGSTRVDSIYVRPGLIYDLTLTGAGADKIYFEGNLLDYTASTSGTNLTLQRTVSGKNETVTLSGGTAVQFDNLVFANGTVNSNSLYSAVRDSTTIPTPAGENSTAPAGAAAVGSSLNATVRAFAVDVSGETFALSRPGINFTVNGSGGVDNVYVADGATVDASLLGGGSDFIYLRGNWADYTKTLITGNTKIQFTRTVGGHAESVTVTAGTAVVFDKLVFADGSVTTVNAKNAITANPNGPITAVTGHDPATTTPGLTPAVTTLNISTAPNLSGQSVISGKALANASVSIVIDPDNNAATSNSFSYTTTADANGNYSLDLATATPASGTASFVAGTASVSATQTASGSAGPATVVTLPVSTTTSYSASIAIDEVTEGGNAVFTVTRSGDTSGAGTVVYTTQNGTGTAPGDYTSTSGTLSFAAGETTKTVTVTTIDDADIEGNETLNLVLSNPVGGILGTASATATLVDNEVGLFSIAGTETGVSFSEGVDTYSFTVNRSGLTTGAATVVVASGGGTATSGTDYSAVNQTLSFAAGETSKTVSVTVNEDLLVEGNETFNLQLSSASAGSLIDAANASVTATIQDNEVAVISIDNAAAGLAFSEGVGSATFSLTRSGLTTSAVTVVVQSTGGTATPGSDYTAVNQTLSFAAGETSKTVTVTVNEDVLVEGNETFNLQLSSPSAGAVIASGSAAITATIQDNEVGLFSIAGAETGVSFSEGVGTYSFTVSRSGLTTGAATVVVASGGGTATSGTDYSAVNQTLSFAAGETSKTVSVTVNEDLLVEGNETFNLQLSSASAGSLIDAANASVTATIQDNEVAVISIDNAAAGLAFSEGVGSATFSLTRSGLTTSAVTVVVQSTGGTATPGSDYTAVNQTISFAAGETSKTVTVTVTDDATFEGNETFNLQLSSPSAGAVIAAGSAAITATIQDNEQSVWSVASAGDVSEGVGLLSYVVSRTGATAAETIQFTTAGGTATAGAGGDYTAVTGQTLSFAAGETSKTVTVVVNDDANLESNETVVAAISGTSVGTIATATASATILDNDQSVWSVASAGDVSENAGTLTYIVSRTGATAAATIQFATAGGTASAGGDYTAVAGQTLTFAAGETSKTITVAINDDASLEGNETVVAAISSASTGSISTASASAAILDDDQSIWLVSSAGNVSEGSGFLTYTVTRTGATGGATIQFATAGGTATGTAGAGNDYTAVAGQTLSFAAGETKKTITVAINDDASLEGNETVVAAISGASGGSIGTATASATILDNDQSIWSVASAGDVSEGSGFVTYTVTRTGASGLATIQFATAGGTATGTAGAGNDYMAVAGQTLTFAAGETSKTITVAINDDASLEGNETVVAAISGASAGTIATATASATILDNDQSIWSVARTGNVDEGAGFLSYVVSRTGATNLATIEFSTAGGDATAGVDYTAVVHQTLSFAAGETSKTVTVAVIDDANIEMTETVRVAISNASAGTINVATDSDRILDNDQSVWGINGTGNVSEGAGFLTYTVLRTGATNVAATIELSTAGGTATGTAGGGNDYTATQQTLSFAIGEISKTVMIAINDDAVAEGNETVVVALSNPSTGSINTSTVSVNAVTATTTIVDNDQSIWSVASAGDASEGSGFLAYTVTRTGATSGATIQFATAGGTATAGSDYTTASQTLSFAAGETSKTVMVAVANDANAEANETVGAAISNASTGTIATATASATVQDDDQSVWTVANTGSVGEGGGFLAYTVTRTGATAAATVQFMTAGGTATAGSDYTAANQTLSFAAGETSKMVTVAVSDDAIAENNETVLAGISNASLGSIETATVSTVIQDNDQPVWGVSSAGNVSEGAGFLTYTVQRTGATNVAATIELAVTGGTATAGSDYTNTPANRTLSFAIGETSKTVMIAVSDDAVAEGNETVVVVLSNASIGTVNTTTVSSNAVTATATILDNDQSIWSVASAGDISEGSGFLTYTVTRTGAAPAATIEFATAGGTAAPGSDYTAAFQTLSFAVGETSKTVMVAVANDANAEVNETVGAAISSASAGTIATATASATVQDDDQSSIWAVSGTTVNEGAGAFVYTVSRGGATDAAASIQFAIVGGAAIAGSDFVAQGPVTLSFAAGETSKTVRVALTDDALAELNETVVAAIGNASTGNIVTASATSTITEDDQSVWAIAAGASSVDEAGNFASYVISRTGASGQANVVFATSGSSTATAGADYTAAGAQTLSFAAGEMSKTVLVPLSNDAVTEVQETLLAFIANVSMGTIATNSISTTILESDTTRTRFAITAGNGSVSEDGLAATYTITRSGDLSGSQTIEYYRTNTGGATAGTDYAAFSPTAVTFAAGETTKMVSVALIGDISPESNESFGVGLRNASGGSISGAAATVLLLDNDTAVAASSYSIAVISDSGNINVYETAGALGYTITRGGDATGAATTYFRTNGGTAAAGSDYTGITAQTLSWSAGETTKVVLVTLIDDLAAESTETLTGQIATDSGFTAGLATATLNILDTDTPATGVNTYSATGTTTTYESSLVAGFAVTRAGDLTQASLSYFRTTNSGATATAGTDYTAVPLQTLSWAVGETAKVVTVSLLNDAVAEATETLVVESASDSAFSTGLTSGTRTLLDDDAYTTTAGVADTLTTGTASGGYLGGLILDTGDMADTVTIGSLGQTSTVINLGSGDDTLNTGSTQTNFFVNGAQYLGGAGVDTLALATTTTFSFSTTASVGNFVTGFEIVSMAASGNQTLNLGLQDVLEFTSGNTVADTLVITGAAGDTLNLQALGKTLSTPAPGNLTDVDGTTRTVVAHAAGSAQANDVTISGTTGPTAHDGTYDVYQYQHGGHTINLLINTLITTMVV